jgi:hypothetical protein
LLVNRNNSVDLLPTVLPRNVRHAELVSASTAGSPLSGIAEEWTLKQVQGDASNC